MGIEWLKWSLFFIAKKDPCSFEQGQRLTN